MGETGLFYAMLYSKDLSSRTNVNGVKINKRRLIYAFMCCADGSEHLVPFIIGEAHKPRCFGKKTKKELDFYYRYNPTAWMRSEFSTEWIKDWERVCR